MEQKTINAELRSETGKNANNKTRSAGFIPGVIYSHGKAEVIKIKELEFFKLFKGRISESVIFNINIQGSKAGASQMAYVKDFQLDPVSGKICHLDLFKVTAGEKITTIVPIELIGTPKGVKLGGVVDIADREIEIECLPMHLPEKITVDISGLGMGDLLHVRDIKLPEAVILLSNPDSVLVSVHQERKVEETAAEPSAAATPDAAK